MLIGWFGLIAVGIFSARYLKGALPDKRIGKLHAWFQIHRAVNFLAVLLIICAALLVLIAKDLRWTGPMSDAPPEYNFGAGSVHSLLGLIAIILSILQPILALCRCGHDHPKRFMFNWTHRFIGLTAVIFARKLSFCLVNNYDTDISGKINHMDNSFSSCRIYCDTQIYLIMVDTRLAFTNDNIIYCHISIDNYWIRSL